MNENANIVDTNRAAVDGAHRRVLWSVQVGDRAAGGIDVFDFTDAGMNREVWSTTGTRAHVD